MNRPIGSRAPSLTEAQYRQLCSACDEVLQVHGASIAVTAIPWLHVIRAHPMFLHLYKELFTPTDEPPLFPRLVRSLRNLVSRARTLLESAVPRSRAWHSSHPLPERVDVLIVSHLLNPAFAGQDSDFYFGQFLCVLHQLGVAFLSFIIVRLLKKMLQIAAVDGFFIFIQPDIKDILQYPL